MKTAILFLLLGAAFGAPGKDPTIKEFEKEFHQKFADPKDEDSAAAELAKQEAAIDEENEEYENGKANFEEELEPWDDLPKDVFEKEKEGLIPEGEDRFIPISQLHGKGLVITPEHERVNTPEERAFLDEIYAKYDRASIPKGWNSKSKGWVSSVKSQGGCGSCTAFATMGMAETSLIKAGAKKSGLDLSEQWIVDCKPYGASGCNGAHIHTYANWMAEHGNLMHENSAPYQGKETGSCKAGPYWSPGYKFQKAVVEWGATDEQIMMQVMEHGSAVIGLYASDKGFGNYKSGIFDTCSDKPINHAVLVVGWGSEKKKGKKGWKKCTKGKKCIPYWLIKNSWGSNWGDSGYIKVKRGTCGINDYGATVLSTVKTSGVADNIPSSKEAPSPPDCDVSQLFGPITGTYELHLTGSDGIFRNPVAICHAGQCLVEGVENSCKAICGKDPCQEMQG